MTPIEISEAVAFEEEEAGRVPEVFVEVDFVSIAVAAVVLMEASV